VVGVVGEGQTRSGDYYSFAEHGVVHFEVEVMVDHTGCFCG
jgi:hypothetical protein